MIGKLAETMYEVACSGNTAAERNVQQVDKNGRHRAPGTNLFKVSQSTVPAP